MARYVVGANGSSAVLTHIVDGMIGSVDAQLVGRAYRVSNVLANSVVFVMRGQGGGRRYRIPNTKAYYTASAPGEPPAVRTGAFRGSFRRRVVSEGRFVRSMAESSLRVNGYLLGGLLQNGTRKMAARPYKEKVIERSLPEATRIYQEPYLR